MRQDPEHYVGLSSFREQKHLFLWRQKERHPVNVDGWSWVDLLCLVLSILMIKTEERLSYDKN